MTYHQLVEMYQACLRLGLVNMRADTAAQVARLTVKLGHEHDVFLKERRRLMGERGIQVDDQGRLMLPPHTNPADQATAVEAYHRFIADLDELLNHEQPVLTYALSLTVDQLVTATGQPIDVAPAVLIALNLVGDHAA